MSHRQELCAVETVGQECDVDSKTTQLTLIFHPSGPNFLRSCMIAWKKHMPNTSFLQDTPRSRKTVQLKVSFNSGFVYKKVFPEENIEMNEKGNLTVIFKGISS